MATTRARLRRTETLLGWVLTLSVLATVAGIPSLFWARDAYGYRSAPTVTVSVTGACETVIRRRGGSGTTCPAAWEVDGERVRGELTTHLGGDLPAPGESTVEARVYGGTARTAMDRNELFWGYYGVWVLGGGLLVSLVLWPLHKRAGRALAATPLTESELQAAERGGGSRGAARASRARSAGDDDVARLAEQHRLGAVTQVHVPAVGYRGSAVFVAAVLLGAFLASGLLRGALVLVAVAWVAFVAFVVTRVRKSRQRTVLYDHGVVTRLGDDLQVMRFDEVEAAWTTPGSAWSLRDQTGRQLVLGSTGGNDDAGPQMVRAANLARLPGLRHRLSVGAQLGFGPVVLSPEGVLLPTGTVAWTQRPSVQVGPTSVVVAWEGGQASYDLAQVPFTQVLSQLVAEQRQAAADGR